MADVAEFRLLGPVEVRVDGRLVDAGQPRQRGVLAALLVDAGRPVPVETLMDRVWGDPPPDGSRHALHTHLGRIRRMLAAVGADGALVRRFGGYLLDVDRDTVDLHRFRSFAERARDPGCPDAERVALLRSALDLWHGEPLAGLNGVWPDRIRDSCHAMRLDAAVRWAEAELRTGDPGAAVGPLGDLAGEHPLAEPVAAVLMRALHAAGRTAEALDRYTTVRRRLIAELGTEPGAELQRVHQAILRGEVERAGPGKGVGKPPIAVAPAQLPRALPGFAGRTAELARLDDLLDRGGDHPPVVISAVSGMAGVGKTTLALHWAHRVADRFPDGQLYINLRGFDPGGEAMTPAEAVRGFLDALAVPAQRIPSALHAQVGLYRSLLAGRRILVVLDNAADSEQVRPLLPGTPSALVVVTSRDQLPGLIATEGAQPVQVDLLTAAEAGQMLATRIGAARVTAEPEAVEAIIDHCGRLPLALAIVAARAALQPAVPLGRLAGELADTRGGLAAFADRDGIDIRAVFFWSYQALSSPAARLFRLLGTYPGPDVSLPAAASAIGLPTGDTRRLLTELTRAHLLAETSPGRYAQHDLLRAYAAGLAAESAELHLARRRMLDHLVHTAHAAALRLGSTREPIRLEPAQAGVEPEELADVDEALAWFGAQHAVLLAAVLQAAGHGLDAHASQLAWTLSEYLDRTGHWRDWVTAQHVAIEATRRLADRPGQARAHRVLATAYSRLGHLDDARLHLARALDLYAEVGDDVGQALTHHDLAPVLELQGRYAEALDHAGRALAGFQTCGRPDWQAEALNAVGWYHTLLGEHARALSYCTQALALHQQLDDRRGQADTWDSIGYAQHQLGNHAEATTCFRRALDLYRKGGNRWNEADTLTHLGDNHESAGRFEAARAAWERALAILTELGHADADQVRERLRRPARLAHA